jgi:hypothetical protein
LSWSLNHILLGVTGCPFCFDETAHFNLLCIQLIGRRTLNLNFGWDSIWHKMWERVKGVWVKKNESPFNPTPGLKREK